MLCGPRMVHLQTITPKLNFLSMNRAHPQHQLATRRNGRFSPPQAQQFSAVCSTLKSRIEQMERRLSGKTLSLPANVRANAKQKLQQAQWIAQSGFSELSRQQTDRSRSASAQQTDSFNFGEAIDLINALIYHVEAMLSQNAPSLTPAPNSLSTNTMASQAAAIASISVEHPEFSVFISHAGEDKNIVAIPLREKLRRRGVLAFVDKMDLPVGSVAPNDMKRAMASATVGVFVLSPEFPAKKWTMLELMTFQERYNKALRSGNWKGSPRMIPFFYRLGLRDCERPDLFQICNSSAQRVFDNFGFPERVRKGETNGQEVMYYLKELSKWTGVENVPNVMNGNPMAEHDHIDQMLDKLTIDIIQALLAVTRSQ